MGSRNSVDRAPSRCSEGHGCDSCWGFFLCPTFVSCCSIPLSHFITELKIHHLYSLIKHFLLDLLTHPLNFNFLFSCEAHGKWSRCRDLNDIQVSASPPPHSSHLVTKAAKDKQVKQKAVQPTSHLKTRNGKGQVSIRTKWPIRPELIPVPVA